MKLRELQKAMAADILGSGSKKTPSYIKPNDRLTSVERLNIYRSQYRQRLIDSLRDDFPGLIVVLGGRAFTRLASAYIDECPSQSFTLRDLGRKVVSWLPGHPEFAGPRQPMALDMARLEWAHIETFDAADAKALGPEDLAELDPAMRLALQPHVRLLELSHPVDDIRIRRKRLDRREKIWLATHRVDGEVFYRRLEGGEFELLNRIAAGRTLNSILRGASASPDQLQQWFAAWSGLGWLVSRSSAESGGR